MRKLCVYSDMLGIRCGIEGGPKLHPTAYCGVTQRCVDNWRWGRKFPAIKIGRVTRFDLAEVDAWLESNRETPAA